MLTLIVLYSLESLADPAKVSYMFNVMPNASNVLSELRKSNLLIEL